jgi:general secretion pathway protein A
MYVDHYKLKEEPFNITPNPKFAWLGEKHAEALATMEYGIDENKGFLVLTGDVGTGKTLMVNCLLNRLDNNTIAVKVQNPTMPPVDFFNFLATKLGWEKSFHTKGKFLLHFENYLYQIHSENKRMLLIIDEAHKMKDQVLEEIRLLSNIELEYQRLLNVFIVGQIELERVLSKEKNKALRERIAIWCHIDPLTEKETGQYIRNRLSVAGAQNGLFDSIAIRQIYLYTKGVPRQINILCDHALLTGFSSDIKEIDVEIIEECAQELKMMHRKAKNETLDQKADKKYKDQATNEAINIKSAQEYVQDNKAIDGTTSKLNFVEKISEKIGIPSIIAELKKPNSASQKFAALTVILLVIIGILTHNLRSGTKEEISSQKFQTYARNYDLQPLKQSFGFETSRLQIHVGDSEPEQSQTEMAETLLEEPSDAGEDLPTEMKNERILAKMNCVIHFKHNSNELNEEAVEKLDRVIEFMAHNPDTRIEVKGFTDNGGNLDYNLYITDLRANLIKTYLTSKVIHNSKIKTKGFVLKKPIASNETLEGKKLNRRVEIEFYGKKPM